MKRSKKNVLLLLTVLIAFIFVFSRFSIGTKAASKPGVPDADISMWFCKQVPSNKISVPVNDAKDSDKVTVSVSGGVIAKAKYDSKSKRVIISPKKAGKAQLKCTVKREGKTYSSKLTFTYVDYKNPIKSIKVGNKEYSSSLSKAYMAKVALKGKQKVTVKTNSEYKVDYLYSYSAKGEFKKWKNGSTIDFNKYPSVSVQIVNKKANNSLFVFLHK